MNYARWGEGAQQGKTEKGENEVLAQAALYSNLPIFISSTIVTVH